MISRSTLIHLRFPFSFFLLPIFLFAVASGVQVQQWKILLSFFIIHILLYPASNGYNSYYDKDTESIGGIKHPPAVTEDLRWASLFLDAIALLLSFLLGWKFVFAVFIYGCCSKAYSHPALRIKKYPIASWIGTGLIQGAWTFFMSYQALHACALTDLLQPRILSGAVLSSLYLMAAYPMTQIYQHAEDSRRGDKTLSILLGIKGTFLFTGILFGGVIALYAVYFSAFSTLTVAALFIASQMPAGMHFSRWGFRFFRGREKADFKNAMRLNTFASAGMNLFFAVFILMQIFAI